MNQIEPVDGIKLLRHNASRYAVDDDLSYPWELRIRLRAPDFMGVAFIGVFGGTEEMTVIAKSEDAIEKFIEINSFSSHPRLLDLNIRTRNVAAESVEWSR